MAQLQKLLDTVLSGRSDRNIRFTDLCRVLEALGFDRRVRGDHHIFTREDVVEIINLQPLRDGKAKPYQVRQCRRIITAYGLGL